MARAEPFKKWRVKTEITDRLESKKKQMNRHDSLTAFIEWVLDMFAKDQLEEATVLRARIEAEMGSKKDSGPIVFRSPHQRKERSVILATRVRRVKTEEDEKRKAG